MVGGAAGWTYHDLGTTAARKRSDYTRLAVCAKAQEGVAKDGDEVGVGGLGSKVAHENAKLDLVRRVGSSISCSGDARSSRNIRLHLLFVGTAHRTGPVCLDSTGATGADPGDAFDAAVYLGKGTCGSRGRGKDKDGAMRLHAHIDDIPALGVGHLQHVGGVHPGLREDNMQLALDGRSGRTIIVVVRVVHGVLTEVLLALVLSVAVELLLGLGLSGPTGRRAARGAVGAANGACAAGEEPAGVALIAVRVVLTWAVAPDGIRGRRGECVCGLGWGRVGQRGARRRGGEGTEGKHGKARLGNVSRRQREG